MDYEYSNIEALKGLTLVSCQQTENRDGNDAIEMVTACGRKFILEHRQDCCEGVSIESIVGDLQDLVGTPLLIAEEVNSEGTPQREQYDDSFTWTFYKFATVKGYVDIRWYGSSNGYYSESVDLIEYFD